MTVRERINFFESLSAASQVECWGKTEIKSNCHNCTEKNPDLKQKDKRSNSSASIKNHLNLNDSIQLSLNKKDQNEKYSHSINFDYKNYTTNDWKEKNFNITSNTKMKENLNSNGNFVKKLNDSDLDYSIPKGKSRPSTHNKENIGQRSVKITN